MAEIGPGKMAPAIELPRDGGGAFSLAAERGRPVVLFFYPQDDTETCTSEALSFSALNPEFQHAGVLVVGISPDSVRSHDRFKAKYRLDLVLVSDEQRAAIEAYGVWVEKTMWGRTYMGVERSTFLIGADGKIAATWRKVRVKNHAQTVLDAARKL
jgi:peroxiredoxin Q/BCP